MLRSFPQASWTPLDARVIVGERDASVRSFFDAEMQRGRTWYAYGDRASPSPEILALADVRALLREVPRAMLAESVEPVAVFGARAFIRTTPQPFLLSEDLDVLVGRWLRSIGARPLPYAWTRAITDALYATVRRYFPDAFLLRARAFRAGLDAACATPSVCGWPIITVSLDRDCAPPADHVIEVTRVRHMRSFASLGEVARPGYPTFREQVRAIAAAVPRRHAVRIIVDGCWSGSEVLRLVEEFSAVGIPTDRVVTGILRRSAAAEFRAAGISVIASHPYLGLDTWICQRDFLPGIPRSGLNLGVVVGGNVQALPEDIGASYIRPFREDIFTDLSVHDAAEFSVACLAIADQLFAAVEHVMGHPLPTALLSRIPNLTKIPGTRFRDELRRIAMEHLRYRDALGPLDDPAHYARGCSMHVDTIAW